MSLIAMTDTTRVEESAVKAIIEPEFTSTWHPTSHAKVIDSLDMAVKNKGLEITSKEYSMNASGSKMFGVWNLNAGGPDGNYALGIRNALDKSMSIGITAGTNVMVCDNMVFSGEYITYRKHTGGLDFDQLVWMANKAIEVTMVKMDAFEEWQQGLKEVAVTRDEAKCITFDFMKDGVIPPSKFNEFGKCVREEYEISHKCSLYTLHGGATRLMRPWSLLRLGEASRKLNTVCDKFIELKAA